jgi:hypothetical protein
VEKDADGDLLREMLTFAAERLMEREVEAVAGAAKGERPAVRTARRHGYRERPWGEEGEAGVQWTPPRRTGGADRAGDPAAAQGRLPAELPGAGAHGRDPKGRAKRRRRSWR